MTMYAEVFSTEASNVLPSGKAATALAVGDLVYLSASGTWTLAVATADGSTNAMGIMVQNALQYQTVSPVRIAEVSGVTVGTVGAKAYISATGTTGNTISASAPNGALAQVVGFYMTTTKIRFAIREESYVETAAIYTVNKTITSAQLLALNATPIEVVAAPSANKAIIIEDVIATKAAGTAYAEGGQAKNLALRYTNGSGDILASIESTGFLDQTTAQCRVASKVLPGIALSTNLSPTAAAAVVIHQVYAAELATGDSDLKLRVRYRVIDTAL
jgi:hypothetical protein